MKGGMGWKGEWDERRDGMEGRKDGIDGGMEWKEEWDR